LASLKPRSSAGGELFQKKGRAGGDREATEGKIWQKMAKGEAIGRGEREGSGGGGNVTRLNEEEDEETF
jgi:hypothetical protein